VLPISYDNVICCSDRKGFFHNYGESSPLMEKRPPVSVDLTFLKLNWMQDFYSDAIKREP
jgi:hypothetical protein